MRISKRLLLGLGVLSMTACGLESEPQSAQEPAVLSKFIRAEQPVRGQYIVKLREDSGVSSQAMRREVEEIAQEMVGSRGGEVFHVYEHAVRGFAARMTEEQAKELAQNPAVEYVEEDGIVSINATQSPTPSWGLDRIDQRNLPLDNSYTYNSTGTGVNAYIIDTGILLGHTDFGGRARTGYDAVTSGGTGNDCNGHGTHVAGTVGGGKYGVAKNVTLYAVRVLDCAGSGTNSGVIAGVNWVASNHRKPAVANMSLGGSLSSTLNTAVSNAIAAGVTFVVAAGNSNANACNYSPASVSNAITVGATTSTDARASYSNYGSCLDIFAPGSSITSDWYTTTSATNTISGTSMASPHVAGCAARYLQTNPTASPATVASYLTTNATTSLVTSPGTGSPNRLLYCNPAL